LISSEENPTVDETVQAREASTTDPYCDALYYTYIDSSSTIENSGAIVSTQAFDADSLGGGTIVMSEGGSIEAPEISGTYYTDAADTTGSADDTYTISNAFITDDISGTSVASGSYMFTSVISQNENGNYDITSTRKRFDTLVSDSALARYLENNYTADKAGDFFNILKLAGDEAEFNATMSKELGMCLLPNFAQENFNVFRSLNNLITDNLYSKERTNERMMVGYDYLALSRSGKHNITGYENNANSSYFIGDVALNKYSRFGLGLGITQFNSDYDDDSDRDETFVQALGSYMYDFKNNWIYAGVARLGFGWGEYTRAVDGGDIDADIHDFVYGLGNELRYIQETPFVTLEPQAELNISGYYQRGLHEEAEKSSAIKTKGTNNLSVESGIGLYASKEFNTAKYGKFKGRLGGSYYHEWNKPYSSIRAHLRHTDGEYKIRSNGIFKRDRFMLGADVTYTYKDIDIYLRGSQYLEHGDVTVLNAGIKFNF
jgi:hypothetical protein